ncbi:hypothetical protein PENDEC_c030G05843 [Penicillium decumbens]|uniref:Uncharacterized protein n=1 Tax=Penicillium decumbens TaxID=69771 RepID=A0A1V6NW18_PENDC|nr:hypothetical protein PENDEC_c030G05843 [Penicillium decumbens]
MYGLKQLALLSFMLLSVSAKDPNKTMVGLETSERSHGVDVPIEDCHELDEDEVFTISIKKYCRVFTGPLCTGRNTVLSPGDHSNDDPVPITSIYCHAKRPY